MMLLCRVIFLFSFNVFVFPVFVLAQTISSTSQLKEKLNRVKQQKGSAYDTSFVNTLTDLAYIYSYTYPDSALQLLVGNAERCQALGYKEGEADTYMITGDAFQTKGMYDKALENYEKSYRLAKDINYKKAFSLIRNRIGIIYLNQANYPEALSKFYESLREAEVIHNNELIGATLNNIAIVHFYQGKYDEAEGVFLKRLKLAQDMNDSSSMSLAYNGLGEVSLQQKNPVKALQNLTTAYNLAVKINDQEMLLTVTLSTAEAYYESDSLQKAVALFEDALRLSKQMNYGTLICNALIGSAKAYHRLGLFKEALANGLEGLQKAEEMGQVQLMRDANEIVSTIYDTINEGKNALKYYKVYKVYSDSMNNVASQRAIAIEKASYEFSKKEIEFQRKTLQQRWIIFSAFTALLLSAVILWLINRNRKRLNHTNKELHKKNEVIENQKLTAEETLFKLQATQAQLIQAEKMASLGVLTSGIAHEIQNPLNFVNNFSELNRELVGELKQDLEKGDIADAKNLAEDLEKNLEKVEHHGKRADAIVKGMLQHSQSNSGKKEQTDINALADEYLRLTYHGLRGKDNTFNVTLKTDFDPAIGNISIIPQDIGRVLLNLYNNAFYAVHAKASAYAEASADKLVEASAVNEKKKSGNENYEPIVSVSSLIVNNKVEIKIADNGGGIPEKIIDKVFQPFFTTKPTGQGTGLGLSLSYDIIKAHGGEIKVKSINGEGTEFIIKLPVN